MPVQAHVDAAVSAKPLVIDLDGTLVRSNLVIEAAAAALAAHPTRALTYLSGLLRGRAALQQAIIANCDFDPSLLPYDPQVLGRAEAAVADGRPVYLASASSGRLAEAVANHLGLFDGWFASDAAGTPSGASTAERLVEAFGEGGFDYIGNDRTDLPIWRRADRALAIRASPSVLRALGRAGCAAELLQDDPPTWRTWTRQLRVHQYAKNALLFVPLLTSHSFSWHALASALLGVIAFSLCASAIYILNDLADLPADRAHPTKRNRPLAAGQVSPIAALGLMMVLLIGGLFAGWLLPPPFLLILLSYLVITTAYSFYLKRKLMVDVVALASLYTIRVIAGAVAIGVELSPWLLAFSLFIFTSLALVKRYVELATRLDAALPDPANRNYRVGDLTVVMAVAAAAGMNVLTILALYVESGELGASYRRPEFLWLLCPLMLYWISRVLVLAHRRVITDDPLVFALSDRISFLTVLSMGVVVGVSI